MVVQAYIAVFNYVLIDVLRSYATPYYVLIDVLRSYATPSYVLINVLRSYATPYYVLIDVHWCAEELCNSLLCVD